MASQEFLASFAVELDEAGITRLQAALTDNRQLAEDLSAAFASAASGLSSLAAEISASLPDLSGFVAAQNEAADAANQASEAISSLAAAYAALSSAIPSDTLSLDFSDNGDSSNESGRKNSDVSASLSEISSLLSRLVGTSGSSDNGSGSNGSSSGGATSASSLTWLVNLDLTKATATMQSFINSASTQFKLTADASEIVEAASSALDSVRSMFNSTTLSVNVTADTSGARAALDDLEDSSGGNNGGSGSGGNSGSGNNGSGSSGNNSGSGNNGGSSGSTNQRMSTGGRFTSPTAVEVAEDGGTEYIIPLEKENQAIPLLRQLMSELSASARAALLGSTSSPAVSAGISVQDDSGSRPSETEHSFPEDTVTPASVTELQPPEKPVPSATSPEIPVSEDHDSLSAGPEFYVPEEPTSSIPQFSDFLPESEPLPQQTTVIEESTSAETAAFPDFTFPIDSLSEIFDLSSIRELLSDFSSVPAASAPTNISYNNVQAPVNIRVTSSEASPEAVGQSVYNAAEKYLLRTLNGVFA